MKKLLLVLLLWSWTTGSLSAQTNTPCQSETHSQFDFWVGEWSVYKTGTDTLLGTNSIRRILGGCVVEENWRGATGFEGKSFNTWNAVDSTWNQVWVDVSGATYHFSGTFQDGVMQLYGKAPNGTLFDMRYTPDPRAETVRQVWKASQDNGATWQVIFDGTYHKK